MYNGGRTCRAEGGDYSPLPPGATVGKNSHDSSNPPSSPLAARRLSREQCDFGLGGPFHIPYPYLRSAARQGRCRVNELKEPAKRNCTPPRHIYVLLPDRERKRSWPWSCWPRTNRVGFPLLLLAPTKHAKSVEMHLCNWHHSPYFTFFRIAPLPLRLRRHSLSLWSGLQPILASKSFCEKSAR